MSDFLMDIETTFEANRNNKNAISMAKYLKNKFKLYGIKNPERKVLQKDFIAVYCLPTLENLDAIVRSLWDSPYREMHYFALDILDKYKNKVPKKTIKLYEYLITHKSWWDSVDMIAVKLGGTLVKKYPELIDSHIDAWSMDDNIWLKRSALLYQLKYKSEINTDLLITFIERSKGTNEFFLNKAIGWVLREYTRTDANWVQHYVLNNSNLANLSKREALRLLK